jgi:hypothetical protein
MQMERSIADELYSDIGEPKAESGQTSNTDVKESHSLGINLRFSLLFNSILALYLMHYVKS